MILESEMSRSEMERIAETHRCAECQTGLTVAWGGYFGYDGYILRCANNINHKGLEKPYYWNPWWEINKSKRKRREEMVNNLGITEQKASRLVKYHIAGTLTKEQATEILKTIWPKAPAVEVYKAALICRDYGLNPLMRHIFLVPFKNKATGETEWATVLSIKSSRILASRNQPYRYLDNTPRLMTEDEQTKVFGEADPSRLWAITILSDGHGNVAQGYGCWPRDKEPYGIDKGNTKANMAFIRSERQALERLCPDALPTNVQVGDESYLPTGEIDHELDVETGEIIDSHAEIVSSDENNSRREPLLAKADEIKTLGHLYKACKEDLGFMPSEVLQVLKSLGYSGKEAIYDVSEAWVQIVEKIIPLKEEA